MNRVILLGRIVRDPDVRYAQNQDNTAIARFTLAVDRRGRSQSGDQQTADFIPCVAFGKQAEFTEKYLKQGVKIAVQGRIQTGSYTNRDGQKVYTTDVILDDIEFAESKTSQQKDSNGNQGRINASAPVDEHGFMHLPDVPDEELPFL